MIFLQKHRSRCRWALSFSDVKEMTLNLCDTFLLIGSNNRVSPVRQWPSCKISSRPSRRARPSSGPFQGRRAWFSLHPAAHPMLQA